MEEIREAKITIYIDTNKITYEQTFTNIDDANEYLEQILEQIHH